MKIALLTIWHCYNYGAEFQTYATVRKLQELGYDVEVIDFRIQEHSKRTSFIGIVSDCLHVCAPAIRHFDKFWKKYIPSTVHYLTPEELRRDPPIADLYLVGSDQVWNPQITGDRAATYFLDFVPEGKMMASYASSFGTDQWMGDYALTNKVSQQLMKFKAIGCREAQGCGIVRETFNLEVTHVVDPTLLHSSYPELTGRIKQHRTLAYYQLSENTALKKFAKRKATEMGLEYVDVNHQTQLTPTFTWYRRSIQQWIRTIAESQFVITHSFHGLVLCLLYHCPFAIIYDQGNRGSRLVSLLRMVGLEDRFFTSISDAEKSDVWSRFIDYDRVDKCLAAERTKSVEYLKRITSVE